MRKREKISNLNDQSIKERFREIIQKSDFQRKKQLNSDLNYKRFFDQQENDEFIIARDIFQKLKLAKQEDEKNPNINWQDKDKATILVEKTIEDKNFLSNQIDTLIKTKSIKIFIQIIKLINDFCYYSNKVIAYCYNYLNKIYDNSISLNDEESYNQILFLINNCISFKSSQDIEQGLTERLFNFVTNENFHNKNPLITKPQAYYSLYLLNVGADDYLSLSKEKIVILIKSMVQEIYSSSNDIYFCDLVLKLMNSLIKNNIFYQIENHNEIRFIICKFIDGVFNIFDMKVIKENNINFQKNDNNNNDLILFQHLTFYLLSILFSSFLFDNNDDFRMIFNDERIQKIKKMIEFYADIENNNIDEIIKPMILLILNMTDSKSLLFKDIYLSSKVKSVIIEKEYKNDIDKIMNIIEILKNILKLDIEEISIFYLKDKNFWEYINEHLENDNYIIIEEILNLFMIILELISKYNKLETLVIFMINKYDLNSKIDKLCYIKEENNISVKASSIIEYLNRDEKNKMFFDN